MISRVTPGKRGTAMCCDDELPPAVGEALARYRALLAESPLDWGAEAPDVMLDVLDLARRWGVPALGPVLAAMGEDRRVDRAAALRLLVTADAPLPPGVVVVDVLTGTVRYGEPLHVLDGSRGHATWCPGGVLVVVVNDTPHAVDVRGAAGAWTVAAGAVDRMELEPEPGLASLRAGTVTVDLSAAVRRVPPAVLELSATTPVRWSVVDAAGQPWAPTGGRLKYDVHDRPFFHAQEATLEVPAGVVRVTAARGAQYTSVSERAELHAGGTTRLHLEPERWWDGDGGGWTGADLHVHANYSGDQVVSLHDAVLMQQGEGLDLMGLVAGNWHGDEIYDQALVESRLGRPLRHEHGTTAFGVEFRNDLLGHFHATGGHTSPARWATGHEGSSHPWDWPANAETAAELRAGGAAIGYCHPVVRPFPPDAESAPEHLFDWVIRSVEARELVVDAALGLVDSIDLLFSVDPSGPAELWYRLLGCGLRLAPTAGTDAFLSFSRAGAFSGPPGSGRVYAWTGGDHDPEAFSRALRSGPVVVTNGPWVRLRVDGQDEGGRIDGAAGRSVHLSAAAYGPQARRLEVVTAGGRVLGSAEGDGPLAVSLDLEVREPTWVAARCTGGAHPDVLAERAWSHTGATWLDVDGTGVRRESDLAFCRRWLDLLAGFVQKHGRFRDDQQRIDVLATVDAARPFYAAGPEVASEVTAAPVDLRDWP
ncbi:CehA/McbA family metallohydrolase [Streptomyces sp. NPDC000229]|uniref:CehA/McbA family metallohydrolase n=1 Tax=Streptomyces sp. NPDC000229 TaxID=3154247 RepID=UPI00331DB2C5